MQPKKNPFESPKHTELSYCRKVVFFVISMTILLLLIYGNSFNCSWQFDDEPNITLNKNIHLKDFAWQNIKKALFSNPGSQFPYRPVACLTFAVNHYFGGESVVGYHITNLLIHWLSSIFLFVFIYHILNLPKLKPKYGPSSYGLALLATTLWAINPVQVQAVTYIVQRMASLAGLFFVMSMYFYSKGRTSRFPNRSVVFFGFCFLSFVMAVSSKENALILPIILFVYEIMILQKDSFGFIKNNLNIVLIVIGFALLLAFGFLYFRQGNIFSIFEAYNSRPFTFGERLLTQPRVIFFYIFLLLYPITDLLNIAHYCELSKSLIQPISTLYAIFGILMLVIISVWLSKKRPIVAFGILFFLLAHVIESSIIPLEIAYEHRNYVPSMFFFLVFMILFYSLVKKFENKRAMQSILLLFLTLYMVALGHATHLRNLDWKTPMSLWTNSLEKSPEIFRPYHNLANQYQKSGQYNKAIQLYNQALSANANNRYSEKHIAYYNLGIIYSQLEKYDKAITYYKRALALNARYSSSHNNLAMAYRKTGKPDLARHHLFKALKLSPGDPSVNLNIGYQYLKENKPHKAIRHLKIASLDEKSHVNALLYQGIAYKNMGLLGKSAMKLEKASKKAPRIINLHLHLAEVYQREGLHDRARKKARAAFALMSNEEILQKVLNGLSVGDDSANDRPDGNTVIPLLLEACREKEKNLEKWEEMLINKGKPNSDGVVESSEP